MNTVAHVAAFFELVNGNPVFKGAGIYSEEAFTLTNEGKGVAMEVFHVTGDDFEQAKELVYQNCWLPKSPFAWLLPYLPTPPAAYFARSPKASRKTSRTRNKQTTFRGGRW